jgi:Protein of unknown function (DUF4058)
MDMKRSPFPGMDPYLEPHWLDVHGALIFEARKALNQVLPDDLAASSEERLAIESGSDEGEPKPFYPDVRLFELTESAVVVADPQPKFGNAAPVRLLVQVEPITERSIRIIETGTERLITVIEFISPSNKRSPGLADFRAKRGELLTAGVNFVEVDLVRAGGWQALLRPHRCPPKWATTYRVTVRMPSDPGAVGLYPISLREPLPSIVIPLRQKDPEVQLELQPLLNQAYENGRYARRLNYQNPLEPPLEPADEEWARALE